MASRRTVVDVLRSALRKLLVNGWIKGDEGTRKAGYCMTGAIYASTKDHDLRERAIDRLYEGIRPEDRPLLERMSSYNATRLQTWNDKSDRQRRSVIALYRRAIARG